MQLQDVGGCGFKQVVIISSRPVVTSTSGLSSNVIEVTRKFASEEL